MSIVSRIPSISPFMSRSHPGHGLPTPSPATGLAEQRTCRSGPERLKGRGELVTKHSPSLDQHAHGALFVK